MQRKELSKRCLASCCTSLTSGRNWSALSLPQLCNAFAFYMLSWLQLVRIRADALQPQVWPDIVRTGARWRNLNVLSGRKLFALQAHSSELGWLRSLNLPLPFSDQSGMRHVDTCGSLRGMFTMPAAVSGIDVVCHNLQVKYHWVYLQTAISSNKLSRQTK